MNKFVSSANRNDIVLSQTFGKSFIYISKIRKVLNVPLGNTTFDMLRRWLYPIIGNILDPVGQVTFKPLICSAPDAIMVQILQQYIMIDSVEGFWEVQVDVYYFFAII